MKKYLLVLKHHFSYLISPFSFQKGFGIPEILFAIGILVVLSIFIVKVFDPYDKYLMLQDNMRKTELKKIQPILERFKEKYGRYPAAINNRIMGVAWGTEWEMQAVKLPQDPDSEKWFIYNTDSNGQMYWLYASLARDKKDSDACSNNLLENSTLCDNVPQDINGKAVVCGKKGNICNYGITSINTSP